MTAVQESATETAEEEAEEEEEEEDEVIWTGLPASRWSQLALHPPQTHSQLKALKVLNVQQAPAALNCVSACALSSSIGHCRDCLCAVGRGRV